MREEKSVYKALFSEQESKKVELESRKVELGKMDVLNKMISKMIPLQKTAETLNKQIRGEAKQIKKLIMKVVVINFFLHLKILILNICKKNKLKKVKN